MGLPGIEQNYQYGLYGQCNPFGGLTVGPKVAPPTSVENPYGISTPTQIGFVSDEGGNQISLGQDGVGLAYKNPNEFKFMAIG